MICPYIVHRVATRQSTSDYDDDGNEIGYQVIERNMAEAMECAEDGCAAWQDGKCCYGGGY